MGIDDLLGQAKDLLNSDQAEGITDGILDKVGDAAKDITGHKFDEQIDGAEGAIDGLIGGS